MPRLPAPRRALPALALPALALTACLLPGPAPAADSTAAFWSLFTPETLVRRVVQIGIGALRRETELQYDHILPDPVAGEVAVTGVLAWPDVPWDGDGCTLSADRVTIRTADPASWDKVRLHLDIIGGSATAGCLAPGPRAMLAQAGIDKIAIAQGSVDLDYTVSSAEAQVRLHLDSPGFALIDGQAHFSYLAANATPGDPDPVAAYLSDASLTLVNQGGWAKLKTLLPERMQDPAMAGAAVTAALTDMLQNANAAAAAPAPDPGDGSGDGGGDGTTAPPDAPQDAALDDAQKTFVSQAGRQVARFMAEGDQIVLETDLPDSEVRITSTFFDDPHAVFRDLRPSVVAHAGSTPPLIEAAMMQKALTVDGDTPDDTRLAVGTALITGRGAPKSVAKGRAILEPLAQAGDTGAALELARALQDDDPVTAYHNALLAAAGGEDGAMALVDGLEERLDTPGVLAVQGGLSDIASLPDAPFASVAALRAEALARMTGATEPRSYALAWFWASLAAAAGDPAATDLRDGIDRRMRLHGPAAEAAWAAARAPVEDAALHEWVARDLGARFGPK